MSNRLQLNSGF
ncbi:hypothetical protein V2J09_015758 [Rumex salicifolius]